MPSIRLMIFAALILVLLAYVSVLVSGGGLMFDGFQDISQKQPVFTLYYMNGCPHCEKILPEYNQFMASGQFLVNNTPVKIRKLEQSEGGSEISSKGIKGFPTLILSTVDGRDIEYSGDRSVPAYKEFIRSNVS